MDATEASAVQAAAIVQAAVSQGADIKEAAALLEAQKWEKVKFILSFCAAGGLGIVVTLFMVWMVVRQNSVSQQFIQTEMITTLKESAVVSGQAANALENAADALKSQVDTQEEIDDSIKDMTRAQDELTEEFKNFIQEQRRSIKPDAEVPQSSIPRLRNQHYLTQRI